MTDSVDGRELSSAEILSLTSDIVAAHVSNNTVGVGDLSQLIEQVYKTLSTVGGAIEAPSDRPTPAVSVKKSITPDYIICL